jgi:hypothetical protein
MHIIITIAIVVIAILFFKNSRTNKSNSIDAKKERLIKKCNGNIERAKRLVEVELQKNKTMTLDKAIDNALYFFERDA